MSPSFLEGARKVANSSEQASGEPHQQTSEQIPSFLQGAKRLNQAYEIPEMPEQHFMTDEEFESEINRQQAGLYSRLGESILGAPGDIASFLVGLFGKEQNILPTSSGIRKGLANLTEGYTEPKTESEKKAHELFSDIGSFLLPGAKKYNIFRNLGIPLLGSLTKEGLKYTGAEDKDSSAAKIGLMVGLDLLAHRHPGGAKGYSQSLFQEAEKLVPEGAKMPAANLQKSLTHLENSLKRGGNRPSRTQALEKVKELKKDIKNGEIDIKNLMAYRPSINEAIDQLGGFEIQLPKAIKERAINNLNDVKRSVIKGLEEYGAKQNPEFLKLHKAANESYAAYQNSNKIAKFMEKNVGKVKHPTLKLLFGAGPIGAGAYLAPQVAAAGIGGAALGTGLYQGFKVFHRVMNSPTLRKYYVDVLNGAAKGNAPQVSKNLKALDQNLEELD